MHIITPAITRMISACERAADAGWLIWMAGGVAASDITPRKIHIAYAGTYSCQVSIVIPCYTAIVTLLTVGLYFCMATRVAVARGKFNVELAATTGNADFERVFRAHVNTLDWMQTFPAPLWLCAIYLSDIAAAGGASVLTTDGTGPRQVEVTPMSIPFWCLIRLDVSQALPQDRDDKYQGLHI
jgi:hypothetical protein